MGVHPGAIPPLASRKPCPPPETYLTPDWRSDDSRWRCSPKISQGNLERHGAGRRPAHPRSHRARRASPCSSSSRADSSGRVSPSPQSANSRCSLAQQFPSTFDAASAMSFCIWTCMTHPPRGRVTRTLLRPRVRSCVRPRWSRIRVRCRPDNPAQSSHRVSHQWAEGHAKAQPRPGRTARRFLRGAFPGADVISVFTLLESVQCCLHAKPRRLCPTFVQYLHRCDDHW